LTSQYPNPANPVSGIFFRTQARALVRRSIDVTVVTPTPYTLPLMGRLSQKWSEYAKTPRFQQDQGVRVHYPRYLATPREIYVGVPDLTITIAAKRGRNLTGFDVIHGHYSYPQGAAAVRLGRSAGIPVVLTLHGDDVNTYPLANAVALGRFKAAVRQADRVLAVSDRLADRTEELTGVRPQLARIGVDLAPFSTMPHKREARARLGLDPLRFVVLFVGHVTDRKGVGVLAEAMSMSGLEGSLCVLVGDGPLIGLASQRSNMLAVGRLENEQVREYMAAADMLVLPSFDEGTPTVVVEAGAASLPIAATAVGGIPALVGGDRGVLFPAHDVDAVRRALIEIRDDPHAAAERAQRLRDFVVKHYDADRTAQSLTETYRELASRSRHGPAARSA
jgi:teichuronic acid biosynthesis glycosyltransferase TuaC